MLKSEANLQATTTHEGFLTLQGNEQSCSRKVTLVMTNMMNWRRQNPKYQLAGYLKNPHIPNVLRAQIATTVMVINGGESRDRAQSATQ
jgi:hypothetical protein